MNRAEFVTVIDRRLTVPFKLVIAHGTEIYVGPSIMYESVRT